MKLKELRKKNGLSQIEIAKLLNVSQSNYSKYERGDIEPDLETLKKMSYYLNASIDEIVENKLFNNTQQNQELNIVLNQLNHVEISKLIHYAEGMIMNRQYDQKQKVTKIIEEE